MVVVLVLVQQCEQGKIIRPRPRQCVQGGPLLVGVVSLFGGRWGGRGEGKEGREGRW